MIMKWELEFETINGRGIESYVFTWTRVFEEDKWTCKQNPDEEVHVMKG